MTRTSIIQSNCLALALVLGGGLIATEARAADDVNSSEVLSKLHHSNQKEIEMGKLATKQGQSKEVKSFGEMLVKDHSAADTKVKALAKQEKVTLEVAPKDDMGSIPHGADFDATFAREMLDDHRKDIAEAKAARDATTDQKLKKLLTELLPTLEKHEQTAQKIVDAKPKSASR